MWCTLAVIDYPMRVSGTRPSPVLSGLGSEAETGEDNGGDKSGIMEEICELIHVLYTISSVCPSPLNLCGAEDDARVTTKLIILQNPRIGKCDAMPRPPTNRPTETGVHGFYTNAQTDTPYLARLQKRSSYKIKASSSVTLLVLCTLKPHGLRRPVMSKSMAQVLGDFEGENNASLGIDRGSMLISN